MKSIFYSKGKALSDDKVVECGFDRFWPDPPCLSICSFEQAALVRESAMNCNRAHMKLYISNELEGDDLLDFLLHVDVCSDCQNAVFLARQQQDARYYKKAKPSSSRPRVTKHERKAS